MTFRNRIILAMIPLFALVFVTGGAGTILLYHLGNRIDRILRENYDSVIYMRDLNEALERIDSSFQFALAGHDQESVKQYEENWKLFDASLAREQSNVTLLGERELVDQLTTFRQRYRQLGDSFFANGGERKQLYFGQSGLYSTFRDIKSVSGKVLRLNQENMETSNQKARRLARSALVWYGGGLVVGVILALLLVANTIRTILYPVRAVTESAMAIGAGDLDQLVPVSSKDELGQLAGAFNTMARHLRVFQQSHQAELVRAHQTSQATIDSFPDPIIVLDRDLFAELANPAARRLLGVLPAQDGKKPIFGWQPPDALREPLADALQHQREYIPQSFDEAILIPVGKEMRSFLPRVLPIRDVAGGTLGAAVLLQDINRFRLLDDVKSNLVATVSHELKTPLTSIRLVLHLLLEEHVGPLTPKQLDLVVDGRDNAERLLVMINNLLDLAKLEQGKSQLQLRPERPANLLQAAAELFRPRAADEGVEVDMSASADLPLVAADAERIQHAFQNLLENALAHTRHSGRITLAAQQANGKVVFSVSDTGAGIPAEYLPFIFEKYYRVPGDPVQGGSGLGLAIVMEIATAHGGTVTCESRVGEGTTFHIALPLWTSAESAAGTDAMVADAKS